MARVNVVLASKWNILTVRVKRKAPYYIVLFDSKRTSCVTKLKSEKKEKKKNH